MGRGQPVSRALGDDQARQALLAALMDAPGPEVVHPIQLIEEAFAQGHAGVLEAVLEHVPVPEPLPWMGSPAVIGAMRKRGARWTAADLDRQMAGSVQRGQADLVRFWATQGANVRARNAQGDTLAHRLVDPPRADGRDGIAPLPVGARCAMLGLLQTMGLSMDTLDGSGQTVLLRALRAVDDAHRAFHDPAAVDQDPAVPSWALVRALLDLGCDATAVGPRGSALLMAFSTGGRRSGVLQALLDRGATLQGPLDARTVHERAGSTPVTLTTPVADAWTRAIRSQDLHLVRLCVTLGEPLTGAGWTTNSLPPLVLAAAQGFDAAVDQLVDAGADLQAAFRHPFWGRHAPFEASLCQETLLASPDGTVSPDDVARNGQRIIERAMLRQTVAQALAMGDAEVGDSPTNPPTPARARARL